MIAKDFFVAIVNKLREIVANPAQRAEILAIRHVTVNGIPHRLALLRFKKIQSMEKDALKTWRDRDALFG